MRRSAFLIMFSLVLVVQFGCSKTAENTNVAPEPAPAVSQFASIADANSALTEGNRLLDDNQTEFAIEAYKRAVEIEPTFAEAFFRMGIAYSLIEKEALRSGSGEVVPGEVSGGKPVKTNSEKMFEQAVTAYKKLITASPDDSTAHFNLGRAYNKLNKDEESEKALEQAVKLKADDTEYQTELGGIRVKLAKYREALGPLKKALEIDAENSQAADLLEDAEGGVKRIDFNQPDNTNTITGRKLPSNTSASNANTAINSNVSTKSANVDSRVKKEELKDKKSIRPTPRPISTRQ